MANNEKMNISYTIRAVDRFTNTHKKLERQLNQVGAMTEALPNNEEIDINADTSDFDRGAAMVEAKKEKVGGNVFVNFVARGHKSWLQFRSDMDRVATSMRTFEEIGQGMARGGLELLLPTLIPLLGSAAGGLGALSSAMVSAGVGAAGFAAVAVPAIGGVVEANEELQKAQEKVDEASNAEERAEALAELKKIQDSLTESQMRTVTKMQEFSAWYKDFAKQFEEPILDVFIQSMDSLKTVLELSQPAIESTLAAVQRLFDQFDRNLQTEEVKDFFAWAGETAGPNLEKLTQTVGNFLMGFLNMMVAFDPLAQDFMDGFLNMSESFREWSKTLESSEGFQKFMDYVRENGPLVLDLIGNMTMFLINLGTAMAPLADTVLRLANDLFALAAEWVNNHKAAANVLGILIMVKGLIGGLSAPIVILISAVRALWPAISVAFKWVGKLARVFTRLMPIVLRVGLFLLRFSNPVQILISMVILLATVIISNWDSIWKATKKYFGQIGQFFKNQWTRIRIQFMVVKEIVKDVIEAFQNMKQKVQDRMKEILNQISDIWDRIGVVSMMIILRFVASVQAKFRNMVGRVSQKMRDLHDRIRNIWDRVVSFFKNIDLAKIGASIMRGLLRGLTGVDVMGTIRRIGGKIMSGFKNFFKISSPSRVMRDEIGRFLTEGVADGILEEKSPAERAAERTAEAIKRPFDDLSIQAGVSYSRTAVSRRQYEAARAERYASGSAAVNAETGGYEGAGHEPQYAIINIGGHEAKGTVEYITREQERSKNRSKRFKG